MRNHGGKTALCRRIRKSGLKMNSSKQITFYQKSSIWHSTEWMQREKGSEALANDKQDKNTKQAQRHLNDRLLVHHSKPRNSSSPPL